MEFLRYKKRQRWVPSPASYEYFDFMRRENQHLCYVGLSVGFVERTSSPVSPK